MPVRPGRLSDYQRFLTEFLRNYETTGSLIPSSRTLATALCRHMAGGSGPRRILEAGPGTGAVTGCIIEHMRPDDRLWMVELNAAFAAHLRGAFEQKPEYQAVASRCELIEGSVQQLGPAHEASFDLVISGLPLNNFSPELVRSVIDAYATMLKPGGVLSFFQYMLVRPARMVVSGGAERTRLKGVGETIGGWLGEREFAREWVWANVPPAWVHHLRF
jgi:phosphatidylethanolamine/phosphatidyl-N-methylethanolamine N-methyltransferase